MPNDSTIQGTPIIAQPWSDFDTVMRHAEKARVAGDRERAHTFFARAVELQPNDARAWAGLASSASTPDEAIIGWAYTLTLAPENLEAKGELDALVQERIVRARRPDAPVLVALGRTLAQVGQKPWAHRLLQRATELDPQNEEAWLWRAGVATDNNETLACLNQVLALNPEHPQARAGLEWAKSRVTPEPAPASSEETAEAESFFEQGQHALRTGNLTRAYEFFRGATNLNPQHESAWYWRGSCAPTTDDAIACLERVLTLNPNNQTAKDALWLLRIKKIRENAQRAAPATSIAPSPRATAPPRRRRALGKVLSLLVSLAIIGVALVIALWIWLNFFAGV